MIKLLGSHDTSGFLIELTELRSIAKVGASMNYHYDIDYSWILQNLSDYTKESEILDVGCGGGALQFYLSRRCNVFSIDRDDYSTRIYKIIDRLRENNSLTFYHGDILNYDFLEQKFDYIICASSLEHNKFETIVEIINKLGTLLKQNGKLLITMMYGNIFGNISLMRGFIDLCLNEEGVNKLISELHEVSLIGEKKYLKQDFAKELSIFKFLYKGIDDCKEFVPLGIGLKNAKS
jgi:SAM-dependent methyltransferase